ncbi:MAG TPA: hypothetical protein VGG39_10345 [Polyangiaceae bacterium]|jgi:hypothetical protein
MVAIFVLEVEGTQGTARMLRFEAGKRVEPITVGTAGQWALVGPGVRDVHAYVAFDGQRLFVQSANPFYAIRVNDVAVTTGWLPVSPPARIAMGGVGLVFAQLESPGFAAPAIPPLPPPRDQEQTRYSPVEVPPGDDVTAAFDPAAYQVSDQDMTRPGVPLFNDEGEATRVNVEVPADILAMPIAGVPEPLPPGLPLAGPPLPPPQWPAAPYSAFQHPVPGPILDLPPPPPPPVAPTGGTALRAAIAPLGKQAAAQWRETSFPKKAVLVMLPFAFLAVYVLFDDSNRQRADSSPPPRPSASALSGSAAPTTASARPVAPPTTAPPSASPPVAPAPLTGGKTPERLAVDAVAAGAYADAARRYEELAREHADQPAYREAARILRAKVDAGAP